MYIRHLLTERLLPANEELYQKMLEWYKKQFNIWKIGKNIEDLKLKIKSSKEKMNSFIKENQLNDFELFITESIYDFFDFFDGDWEVIENGKVEKYTEKKYSKSFDNGFEFILNIVVVPRSSVLEVQVKYQNKIESNRSAAVKVFEFDLSERFYAFIPEDILKWFKEDGFFIHDEYEEIYYNIKDNEDDLAEDLKIAEKISEDDIERYKKFYFEEDGKTFYMLGVLYTKSIVDDYLKNGAHFIPSDDGSVVISSEFIYKYGVGWLEETLEHELRHVMQYLNKETGKFNKIQRGLPKKKLQTKSASFGGRPKDPENAGFPMEPNDPSAKRILHNLRDVEFQTNLGSVWFDLKKELKKIRDPNIRNSIFLNAINPSSNFQAPFDMQYETEAIKKRVKHSLDPLRDFDKKKWEAYVKMLYQLYQKEFS